MEISEAFCQTSVPELVGFDWSLKVVAGSSSLSTLQQPLVEVDFYLNDLNKPIANATPGSSMKNFTIEMNQSELKSFITALEKAYST